MPPRPLTTPPRRRTDRRPRHRRVAGLTFVEVLFAVILLGIGFIMIAAIFPVAIAQSQTTMGETSAISIARQGASALAATGTSAEFPVTNFLSKPPTMTDPPRVLAVTATFPSPPRTLASTICNADPRYGWVTFYRRDTAAISAAKTAIPSSFAQVITVACKNTHPNFEHYKDVAPPLVIANGDGSAPVSAVITYSTTGGPNTIQLTQSVAGSAKPCDWADQGAFVIVGTDANTGGKPIMVGRIFRLGPLVGADATSNTFQIDPAYDLIPDTTNKPDERPSGNEAGVFVVGKPLADPTSGYSSTNTAVGAVQDLACQSTYVPLN